MRPELIPVLLGLWRFYNTRLQLRTAREIGETLLRLAQRAHDPALAAIAHPNLGLTWFLLSALPIARHFEEGITLHARPTPVSGVPHGPRSGCCLPNLCRDDPLVTGYPAQALAHVHGALALAHELSHPYSLAFAQFWAAWVSQVRRDVPAPRACRGRCRALNRAGLSQWAAWGTSLRGWALGMRAGARKGWPRSVRGLPPGGPRGSVVRPMLLRHAGRRCAHLRPHGRRPPGAGRGAHPGGAV